MLDIITNAALIGLAGIAWTGSSFVVACVIGKVAHARDAIELGFED